MSALNRDKARSIVQYARNLPLADEEYILDRLEGCVAYGWESLWQDLNEIYAEDIIPTRHVPADDGNGPQIVSLLRLLGRAEAKLARIEALCDEVSDGAPIAPQIRMIARGDQ
jgi:hypothetical protein